MNNELHLSESLYLRQHKDNPVYWKCWSPEIWNEAQRLNKLVIVSIGYSSCHWCHVMERESFEKREVADVMNAHFISIKVDREERPDIDQVYMAAVQLMAGQGGWPLNVVCLPDKRPIWGGTYFPREQWTKTLLNLQSIYQSEPQKVLEYAAKLEEGLHATERLTTVKSDNIVPDDDWLRERINRVEKMRDYTWGGYNRSPKFPMPCEQIFLMQAAEHYNREELGRQVELTLTKMAWGGIYDYIGGGFCRYSVDNRWKVPHFEKMLYDNAQLLSLYAIAHRRNPDPLFAEVIEGIIRFLREVFRTEEGLYQAAIDADSEGVEGKFYVWSKEELKEVLEDDYVIWETAFDFDEYWEDNLIIFRKNSVEKTASICEISMDECREKLEAGRQKLHERRKLRIAPATDNKVIAAWNGLLISGLTDAYLATANTDYLEEAENLANALWKHLFVDNKFFRIYAGENAYIPAMLEDYAALSKGLLELFACTGNPEYFTLAEWLINYVEDHFTDPDSPFFFTTGSTQEEVIMRSKDLEDNVIPSPNALMAEVLRRFTQIHFHEARDKCWRAMVGQSANLSREIKTGFYLWGQLYLHCIKGSGKEWVVSGARSREELPKITTGFHDFYTDIYILPQDSRYDLFAGRYAEQIRHFICKGQQCMAPVEDIAEARKQLG